MIQNFLENDLIPDIWITVTALFPHLQQMERRRRIVQQDRCGDQPVTFSIYGKITVILRQNRPRIAVENRIDIYIKQRTTIFPARLE